MDGPDRYVEQAEAKRQVAAELRRIARTVSQADRVILVSHASTLEVEAAALDEEAVRHQSLMRA